MYILHKDTLEVFKKYLGALTDNEKIEVHDPVEVIPDGVILKPQYLQEVLFPTNDY